MNTASNLKSLLVVTGVKSVTETAFGFRIESGNNELTVAALIAGGWKAKDVNGYVIARV